MRVKFLRDFRGRATNEIFYEAGVEVDLSDDQASAVISEGAAEAVKAAPPPKPHAEPAPAPVGGRRAKH